MVLIYFAENQYQIPEENIQFELNFQIVHLWVHGTCKNLALSKISRDILDHPQANHGRSTFDCVV